MVITKILILYSSMKTIDSRKLLRKKVLIPVTLGIGVLASAIFIASPIAYTWGQQQEQTLVNDTYVRAQDTIPQINGSVSVKDNIKDFLIENTKVLLRTAAETAQKQIANGTVLGGHIGVTQGYLTYTYVVVDPAKDTLYRVIIDAGNGQVLYTSEGRQMGSFGQTMFGPFRHGGIWHGPFGPFGSLGSHGLAGEFGNRPFGFEFGFGPWKALGGFMGGSGPWY
jgi:hypothetical protein